VEAQGEDRILSATDIREGRLLQAGVRMQGVAHNPEAVDSRQRSANTCGPMDPDGNPVGKDTARTGSG
jgi:hypothetical protein